MQEKLLDKFWTLPNAISLVRLIFGAPVILILYHNGYEYAWAVFLLFVFTDWLDGWIARRFKFGSSWGMLLDPLADQLFVLPIIWMFSWYGIIAYIPPVVLTVREAVMVLIRIVARRDIPAQRLGKLKTIFEYIGIAFLLFGGEWYLLGLLMFFPIMFFAIVSLAKYAHDVFLRESAPC